MTDITHIAPTNAINGCCYRYCCCHEQYCYECYDHCFYYHCYYSLLITVLAHHDRRGGWIPQVWILQKSTPPTWDKKQCRRGGWILGYFVWGVGVVCSGACVQTKPKKSFYAPKYPPTTSALSFEPCRRGGFLEYPPLRSSWFCPRAEGRPRRVDT
jgi:hypothetical protein